MPVSTRPYIILLKTPANEFEAWEDLKKCCMAYGWSYNTFSKKSLPVVTKEGHTIYRINI